MGGSVIDLKALEQAVAGVEPAAYFVSSRLLRRVIKRDRGLVFLGPYAARPTTYTLPGAALGRIVEPADVPGAAGRGAWPETVYLLERPKPEVLASDPPELLLSVAWRRLFRLKLQAALRGQIERGLIDPAGLQARIARVGRVAFEEARLVLRQDGWLVYPEADAEAYALFAAHFLELHRFAPSLLRVTFPAVERPDDVAAALTEDVDAEALFASTRPEGAPALESGVPTAASDEDEEPVDESAWSADDVPDVLSELADWVGGDAPVSARARSEAQRGNFVRAALLWTRAATDPAPPSFARAGEPDGHARDRARAAAASLIGRLAERLRLALGLRASEAGAWAAALIPLLDHAAHGFWTPEARLLYDLQRVCLDHERAIERLDLVGWLFTLGRRPFRRPLPHLREVSISNRLRAAVRRLSRVRLGRDGRIRLESLLRPAVHHAEAALRDRFRPTIDRVLQREWTAPANVPERVAYDKLVEELLDRLVDEGHLTLADLRDSASRGDLKLPDLAGPTDLWQGGPLLRTDAALAGELEGVYRRGEVYLRALQRFSMIGFGTPVGRWLTLFGALPFGGAYVALVGLQHLVELFGVHVHLERPELVAGVGLLALGTINFPTIRGLVSRALAALGRLLRRVLVDLPASVLESRLLQRLVHSGAAALAWHMAFKPGVAAAAAWLVAEGSELGDAGARVAALAAFSATIIASNTRAGRALEESVSEAVVRGWTGLVHDLVPGLFRLVMSFFQRLLEMVERVFYAVDEALRFRGGQSRLSLAAKALIAPVWAGAVYVARVAVNVLIEPQVNPIKHFPVVTVSHKILLPLAPQFVHVCTPLFGPIYGKLVGGGVVMVLPGMFGFLVWELLSNWRLYQANRPPVLSPVMVGSHGETVARLLRPGFHSGTLPKAFSRLRRARRRAWMGQERLRSEKAAFKQREALHHVEDALRNFAHRDLVALLARTPAFGDASPPLRLGDMHLATNRVRLELLAPEGDENPAWLDLEERSGRLVAGFSRMGWLDALDAERRRTLDDALAGWFEKSGVDLVQTPGQPLDAPAIVSHDEPWTAPVNLGAVAIAWSRWVDRWETEPSKCLNVPLAGQTGVLPAPTAPTTSTGSSGALRGPA